MVRGEVLIILGDSQSQYHRENNEAIWASILARGENLQGATAGWGAAHQSMLIPLRKGSRKNGYFKAHTPSRYHILNNIVNGLSPNFPTIATTKIVPGAMKRSACRQLSNTLSINSTAPSAVTVFAGAAYEKHVERYIKDISRPTFSHPLSNLPSKSFLRFLFMTNKLKTGPEEAQYFHVRPPIGFI